MKKIILLLAFAVTSISVFSQALFLPRILEEVVGINSFLGGNRYGHKWPSESLVPEVKLKRFFITFGEASEKPGIHALDRTWKGWAWKESLQAYKAQNVKVILATAGGFYYQTQDGNINKRLAISKTDDPYNADSWKPACRVIYNMVALYGNNPDAVINQDELQKAQTGTSTRWATEPVAGQNLIYGIELFQEMLGWGKNWNGVTQVADARMFAVAFWEGYKAAKAADPNIKVIVGALVHNNPELNEQFRAEFKKLTGVYPESLPGVIYNFHHYLNNGMLGQTRTGGISPEQINLRLDYWDGLNAPYMITEFGYDDIAGSIQRTPLLPGLNAQQSQWEMNLRNIAWYATGKNCIGIVAYEIRNENNTSKTIYNTTGLYTKTYAPKDGLPIFQKFISNAKGFVLPAVHTVSGTEHVFIFQNGGVMRYKPDGVMQYGSVVIPPDTITPPPDTIVPPSSLIVIKYSLSKDRTNAQKLSSNMVLKIRTYYVFVESSSVSTPPVQLATPVNFLLLKNGKQALKRGESSAPFTMNGDYVSGSNVYSKPFTFTAGLWTLTVTSGVEKSTVTFTVK